MADELLSDEEREEALLQWWRENWRWILAGIVVGIAVLFGWRYWQGYRVQRAEHASQLYAEAQSALNGNDLGKAEAALKQIETDFSSTAYTQQAQLLLAKAYVEAGEFAKAEPLLQAVVGKSKDKELADIAQLRLARLLVQQGKHDEAVRLLQPLTTGGFSAQAHEIRGDALVAKGDAQGARAEYAAALASTDAQLDRALVELKLQDAGGVAPATEIQGQP